jgi:hypothetical protein
MCHLITFATTHPLYGLKPPRGIDLKAFKNRGGGHVYDENAYPYEVSDYGCGCELFYPYEGYDTLEEYIENTKTDLDSGRSNDSVALAVNDVQSGFSEALPLRKSLEEFFVKIAIDFGKIEFIVHYHNGAIDTEWFEISRVETIEVSPGYNFLALEMDVKYVLLGGKS